MGAAGAASGKAPTMAFCTLLHSSATAARHFAVSWSIRTRLKRGIAPRRDATSPRPAASIPAGNQSQGTGSAGPGASDSSDDEASAGEYKLQVKGPNGDVGAPTAAFRGETLLNLSVGGRFFTYKVGDTVKVKVTDVDPVESKCSAEHVWFHQ